MKLKNRQELAKYFNSLGFKIGAEIGVATGYYSKVLMESIPGLVLYGIDPWARVYGGDEWRWHRYSLHDQAMKNLSSFIESGAYKVIRKTSMDALDDIKDESLDFVFIDANHDYKYVKEDIEGWARKVRKGGIVSGHDYHIFFSGKKDVIIAVDEYVKNNNLELLLTSFDLKNADKDSRRPCWYFFKK